MEIKEVSPEFTAPASASASAEMVKSADEAKLEATAAAVKTESKCDSESGEVVQEDESPAVMTITEKPDLNKSGGVEEENHQPEQHQLRRKEEVDDDQDEVIVVTPAIEKQQPSSATAPALPPAKDKDELLLTLGGGTWGTNSKKLLEEALIKERISSGKALVTAAAASADVSLSLGSSLPSRSVLSGRAATRSVRSISNTTTVSPSHTKSFVHNPSCSLTHNSFDELNSSATQYIAGHENETVSHGGVFAHLATEQGLQRYRNALFESNSSAAIAAGVAAKHHGSVTTTTNNNNNSNSNSKEMPTKWNSYNLEKYHALFPDLKEGFRAKYAGTRRSKHSKPEELGKSLPGENRVGLHEIASDPIAVVAHKLQELPDIFLEDLKRSLTEMLGSVEKRDEFLRLQKILQRRNDLSAETLYLAHRTQLELLVAMKTGIQAFLLRENPLSTSALVEIFLQKKCRNFACQNQLPADDCECQFCSQKEGFCNVCMCIACSKFDFMANTCRWVGCDFCLHWCHTDCGIRLSYIKPGTATNKTGPGQQFEMQFVCVACNHASDLFGFVREVFMTYSKDWSPETLRQELDCIQRIFRRSQDFRGKQLCWIAERMLGKVEGCTDTSEICETLVRFFQEGNVDLEKVNANHQKLKAARATEVVMPSFSNGGPGPGDMMKKSAANANGGGAGGSGGGGGGNNLQVLDRELEAKRDEIAEMQYSRARKRSEIEEMESLIHIKQAEAKMFELRAEEARLEAERLRKIVVAKSEKIEEEYVAKGYKLHVNNAIEKRKRCFVEYQTLEQGLQDFNSMKAKLVTDVHDVLRKMDVMKRNRML